MGLSEKKFCFFLVTSYFLQASLMLPLSYYGTGKNKCTPCYKDWIELMTVTASYEMMIAKVNNSVSKFTEM